MLLIVSAERPAAGVIEAVKAGILMDAFPLRPWRFRRVQTWRVGDRSASVLVRVSARLAGCQANVWLNHMERAGLWHRR